MSENTPRLTRRTALKGAAGVGAAAGLGLGGTLINASPAGAYSDGHGLRIIGGDYNHQRRLRWFRFGTDAVGWAPYGGPAVNILLPSDYFTTNKRYPVLYLFHGGQQDFRTWASDRVIDLEGRTNGKGIIIVMPDGGPAGWYSNPVSNNRGEPRNWETFHIAQLLPWVEQNFRTWAEYNGRAVAGFSMGGFGALKYAAKYYGHFAAVSSHSGPASIRRDAGLVTHWANLSSAAVELNGGTVYGAPLWDEARVTADNPVQRVPSFANKRVSVAAGTGSNPIDPFGYVNETQVLAGQREFRAALAAQGIPFISREHPYDANIPGGHFIRPNWFHEDLNGIIGRLRKAG